MRCHRSIVAGVALGLAVARAAQADPSPPYHFFSTDQVHINDSAPEDGGSGIVGWASADLLGNFQGASAPTVTYSGAGWKNDMYVYNGSTVNFRGGMPGPTIQPGGTIYGPLYVYDNSKVNVSEQGSVPFMYLYDSAVLTMSGGDIGKVDDDNDGSGVYANGSSTVNISGGFVFDVNARDSSTINISGGLMPIVNARGAGCSATISGGVIVDAGAGQGATMNISGGNFTSVGCTDAGSTLNFSGGTVATSIFAGFGATLNFNSGSASSALCQGSNATLNIGGSISGSVTAGQGALVTISGTQVGSLSATAGGRLTTESTTVAGDVMENNGTLDLQSSTSIQGNLDATDGTVTCDADIAGNVALHGIAVFALPVGRIEGAVNVQDSSDLIVLLGTAGAVTVANFGNFDMGGGSIQSLSALNSSSSQLAVGTVIGNVDTYNSSVATVSDLAVIDGKVSTHNSSQVIINNGVLLGEVDAYDSSTVLIGSGYVAGPLHAFNNATIIWAGGAITGTSGNSPHNATPVAAAPAPVSIYVYDNATIIIRGVHLSSLLVDGNSSDGTNTYSLYELSGFLGDGSVLTSNIQLYVQHPTTTFPAGGSFQFTPADQIWNTAASGSWTTGSNWLPAIAPGDPGCSIVFNDPGTDTPITISMNGDHSAGTVTMAGTYAFNQGSGGTLFLNNNGSQVQFLTAGGVITINAPVAAQDSTLINVQDTTLKLTAGITVAAGQTLGVSGDSPLQTAFVRGGTLKILGGSVQIIPNGTASGLSQVENLVILDQSILDLTNNDMIVTGSGAAAVLALLQTQYKISSSTAAPGMGIGMLSGAQYLALHPGAMFDGVAVAETDALLKYVPLGDGDMDGRISMDDYLLIDEGYANQNASPSWINGDFNFDGTVDDLDYALIDFSYMQQAGTQAAGEISEHTAEFGAAYVSALDGLEANALPEPGSLALLGMGVALLVGGRRVTRRRC